MAVTLAQFRNAYSEFRKSDDGDVSAKLMLAELEVNRAVWGPRADAGVMLVCAHFLAMAPAGQNAKLKPPQDGETMYFKQYKRTRRAVTSGFARTAGMPRADAFTDIIINSGNN